METKIIPFEKMNWKDDEVAIDNISITYIQPSDCTEEKGAQEITLSTRNNGVSRFFNIKSKDGWSFSSIEELRALLNDFKRKAGL